VCTHHSNLLDEQQRSQWLWTVEQRRKKRLGSLLLSQGTVQILWRIMHELNQTVTAVQQLCLYFLCTSPADLIQNSAPLVTDSTSVTLCFLPLSSCIGKSIHWGKYYREGRVGLSFELFPTYLYTRMCWKHI
jgi:hypothetical protein